ncbi:erythropoiesis-stimulating protein [Streptomyces sp. PRKS01-65]|nr:helix-turn-helix transcriptional regulator [Streptomyces harenosi]NEY30950.1 erythropoiesis-stimulating protein [Streptomyces harenosi]
MSQARHENAQRLYSHIVRNPSWSLTEIKRSLALSQREFDVALEHLVALNLLVASGTAPSGWTALTPDSAVHATLTSALDKYLLALHDVSTTREAIESLVNDFRPLHCRISSEAQIEVLVGPLEVSSALEDAARHARYRVLSVHPGKPLPAPMLQEGLNRDALVLARGVEMRTIHLAATAAVPHVAEYLRQLAELGGQVRTAQLLPMRMIIIDHTLAFVPMPRPLRPADETISLVRLRGEVLVGILEEIFEHDWARSTAPLPPAPQDRKKPQTTAPGTSPLTARQREVLQMLAAGLTDEAISRKLGVSERTVGRHVAELITQLQAESRFQAGFNAARLGWLGEQSVD